MTEILAATSGSLDKPNGLVMALGTFNVDQLTAALAAKSSGASTEDYNGAKLVLGKTENQQQEAIGFMGSTVAVLGDVASVKAAIDRSWRCDSINPALATQVQNLSLNNDAWVVTTNSITALMPGLAGAPGAPAGPGGAAGLSQMAQMFKGIVGSNGGIKFGDMVVITGQAVTVDAPTAKSLADVVQAIASIAAMAGAGNDPNVAALAQLMQGLKVTADGVNVNITLSVPEAQLEAVINQMKKPRAAPAARPGTKPALAPGRAPAFARRAIALN